MVDRFANVDLGSRRTMERMVKAHNETLNSFSAHYINEGDRYRVWRDGWASDQFEVISPEQFANLEANCKTLSIPLVDHTNDD